MGLKTSEEYEDESQKFEIKFEELGIGNSLEMDGVEEDKEMRKVG